MGGSSYKDVGDSVIRCVYKEVSNLDWIWGRTNKKKEKTTINQLEQINSTSGPRVIQVSGKEAAERMFLADEIVYFKAKKQDRLQYMEGLKQITDRSPP